MDLAYNAVPLFPFSITLLTLAMTSIVITTVLSILIKLVRDAPPVLLIVESVYPRTPALNASIITSLTHLKCSSIRPIQPFKPYAFFTIAGRHSFLIRIYARSVQQDVSTAKLLEDVQVVRLDISFKIIDVDQITTVMMANILI